MTATTWICMFSLGAFVLAVVLHWLALGDLQMAYAIATTYYADLALKLEIDGYPSAARDAARLARLCEDIVKSTPTLFLVGEVREQFFIDVRHIGAERLRLQHTMERLGLKLLAS